MLDRDIYKVSELVIILQLNRSTISKAIVAGELPSIDYGGSSGRRVLHEDVIAWLKRRRDSDSHHAVTPE